jgi:metal-dependent amidase/aminoacylase/carboxypeptidase family protein
MKLESLGFTVQEKVGGTGVIGIFENGKGKTVLLRSELDALAITEATGLPHASKIEQVDADGLKKGVMHACSHDMLWQTS